MLLLVRRIVIEAREQTQCKPTPSKMELHLSWPHSDFATYTVITIVQVRDKHYV